jgi:L-serine dehydratase
MLCALDMFTIGIGPSSSHTVGPMKAALNFIRLLDDSKLLDRLTCIKVNLFGSLALTGVGHGTNLAIVNGLCGEDPTKIDPDVFTALADKIKTNGSINVLNKRNIKFNYAADIILHKQEFLPQHANGMRFVAYGANSELLFQREYFSIGGGFVLDENEINSGVCLDKKDSHLPYSFSNARELTALCREHDLSIAQLAWANELSRSSAGEGKQRILDIIEVMSDSIKRGVNTEGILPGGLGVRRRAPGLYKQLAATDLKNKPSEQRLLAMTCAMAVNEENAAFGRVVTAPTNGSSGTIPGVLEYYLRFSNNVTEAKLIDFILTAGVIGVLFKQGASISAAEVGCQGEIGVSCSMAAAALAAVLGGNVMQIQKAAEIAMEHSLGMTCDPIGGLVQVPCIERNGVAASRAIDIANLVLLEPEAGIVSLDDVIKTMLQTGKDMSMHYKETSLGGLAVNMVNC